MTRKKSQSRPLCLSENTLAGEPCRNYADTCPYPEHRRRGVSAVAATAPIPDDDFDDTAQESEPGVMPEPLQALASEASDRTESATIRNVIRDYWLTRCLYSIHEGTGGTGRLFEGHENPALDQMVCVFGGGSSLVSSWHLIERISEDLDLVCLMDLDTAKSALRRPFRRVREAMVDGCGIDPSAVQHKHHSLVRFRQTLLPFEGNRVLLKIETALEAADDSLFAYRTVKSIMSRFASPEQLAEFPELGEFSFPAVVPAYTIANKMDALHRRSMIPRLTYQLADRGRDLHDMAAVASSVHADEVRERLPALASRAAGSEMREVIPRPRRGYGSSMVFLDGTDAYETLRVGYENAKEMLWHPDTAVPFEDAVEMAVSLDDGSR